MEKEIIDKIEKLKSLGGNQLKKARTQLLKDEILEMSGVKEKGVLEIGGYVLEWHPKMKSKRNQDGVMMIYTKESYERSKNYRREILNN